jgi:hypothetical protein
MFRCALCSLVVVAGVAGPARAAQTSAPLVVGATVAPRCEVRADAGAQPGCGSLTRRIESPIVAPGSRVRSPTVGVPRESARTLNRKVESVLIRF